jgi:hypothetical protein
LRTCLYSSNDCYSLMPSTSDSSGIQSLSNMSLRNEKRHKAQSITIFLKAEMFHVKHRRIDSTSSLQVDATGSLQVKLRGKNRSFDVPILIAR